MVRKSDDITSRLRDDNDLRRPPPEMSGEPYFQSEAVARAQQQSPLGWNNLVATVVHWSDEFGPIVLSAAALMAVLGGMVFWASGTSSLEHEGVLRVESDPQGLEVQINGERRGPTPLAVTLIPGLYGIRLEHRGQVKQIEAVVAEGKETTHHMSWSQATPVSVGSAAPQGILQVTTDPPGALVDLDGVHVGVSPLELKDITPGDHVVVVKGGGGVYRRVIRVTAGVATSMVIGGIPVATSGWMEAKAPIALQIFDAGTQALIGTTEARSVMLSVGRHDLVFANDALGFRTRQTVEIRAGQTSAVSVPVSQVPLNVNATPWAQVWIDGQPLGETPLASVLTTIGTHEIEFRHPELGRKVIPVRISLNEPARVSVDMRIP